MNNEIKEILDFKENADYKRLSCDEIAILKDYITNLQHTEDLYNQLLKDYDELQERIEKATNDLFELKDMIYKPETRDENIPIQQKISSIIKRLNGRSDE